MPNHSGDYPILGNRYDEEDQIQIELLRFVLKVKKYLGNILILFSSVLGNKRRCQDCNSANILAHTPTTYQWILWQFVIPFCLLCWVVQRYIHFLAFQLLSSQSDSRIDYFRNFSVLSSTLHPPRLKSIPSSPGNSLKNKIQDAPAAIVQLRIWSRWVLSWDGLLSEKKSHVFHVSSYKSTT